MSGSRQRCGSGVRSRRLAIPPRAWFLRCAVLLGAVVLWGPAATAQGAPAGGPGQPSQNRGASPLKSGPPQAEPQSAAKAEPVSMRGKTWYASSLSRNDNGSYLVVHFWSKGARFRAESVIAGHRVTTIVNGETYYVIDPVLGTGAAIERSARAVAQDAARGRPFGIELEQILNDGAEKVRTESVNGRECELYRVTDAKGRRQVCVSTGEPPVPLHVENFDRQSGRTTYVDYTNWVVGPLISDTFFEPDPRIEMERVGYQEYQERLARGQTIGPAPVLYGDLLHGRAD